MPYVPISRQTCTIIAFLRQELTDLSQGKITHLTSKGQIACQFGRTRQRIHSIFRKHLTADEQARWRQSPRKNDRKYYCFGIKVKKAQIVQLVRTQLSLFRSGLIPTMFSLNTLAGLFNTTPKYVWRVLRQNLTSAERAQRGETPYSSWI